MKRSQQVAKAAVCAVAISKSENKLAQGLEPLVKCWNLLIPFSLCPSLVLFLRKPRRHLSLTCLSVCMKISHSLNSHSSFTKMSQIHTLQQGCSYCKPAPLNWSWMATLQLFHTIINFGKDLYRSPSPAITPILPSPSLNYVPKHFYRSFKRTRGGDSTISLVVLF